MTTYDESTYDVHSSWFNLECGQAHENSIRCCSNNDVYEIVMNFELREVQQVSVNTIRIAIFIRSYVVSSRGGGSWQINESVVRIMFFLPAADRQWTNWSLSKRRVVATLQQLKKYMDEPETDEWRIPTFQCYFNRIFLGCSAGK